MANPLKILTRVIAALDEGDIELLKTYVSDCHFYALFSKRA